MQSPVRRGVGRRYVTLQHFWFRTLLNPPHPRFFSSLYPLCLALCPSRFFSISDSFQSFSASLPLSLSLPPSVASRLIAATNLSWLCSFLTFLNCFFPCTLVSLNLLHSPSLISIYPSLSALCGSDVTHYRLHTFPRRMTVHRRALFSHSFFFLPPSPAEMLNLCLFITRF